LSVSLRWTISSSCPPLPVNSRIAPVSQKYSIPNEPRCAPSIANTVSARSFSFSRSAAPFIPPVTIFCPFQQFSSLHIVPYGCLPMRASVLPRKPQLVQHRQQRRRVVRHRVRAHGLGQPLELLAAG